MTTLILSPEPWTGHFVSKHHYAIELASRGVPVIFHGPPEPGGMWLEPVEVAGTQLQVLHAPRVAPGLRHWPAGLRRRVEARWLARVEALARTRITAVWLFENSRFYDMRFAKDRLKIYHQVDLNQNFHPEIAAKTADHVFCTSRPIRDRLAATCRDVTIIHHGVRPAPADAEAPPPPRFDTDRVNCVYVGNLSMSYLDRDLILRSIDALPEANFHFFGGFTDNDPFERELSSRPNAILHGRIPADRILPTLEHADILLVTYQERHFIDQSNPHKLMEYMMSGKVTVATYTSEYADHDDLLEMVRPGEDYVARLAQAARDLPRLNAAELQNARRAFALDNSYARQLDRIAAQISPRSKELLEGIQ